MMKTNETIDFQRYIIDKDVDSRIKSSRDDMLKIIQADIKVLNITVVK